LSEVIAGYLNALRLVLFPYVSSKDAFLRIRGQEPRTVLLRFVIEKNEALNAAVARMVAPMGWECATRIRLMAPPKIRELLLWYGGALGKKKWPIVGTACH
jgi:hypothetical protein